MDIINKGSVKIYPYVTTTLDATFELHKCDLSQSAFDLRELLHTHVSTNSRWREVGNGKFFFFQTIEEYKYKNYIKLETSTPQSLSA